MTGWGVIPSVRVTDMASALRFYSESLGFRVERGGPDDANCVVTRGDARLMLETAADHYGDAYNKAIRQRIGTPSAHALYIEADDLDELEQRVARAGATIIDPLAPRAWGQREFTVEDGEGNWLTFWRAEAAE